MSFLQYDLLGFRSSVIIGDGFPFSAPPAFKTGFGPARCQVIVTQTESDKITDSSDLHSVMLGKFDQVIEPRHFAVILHDLADHTGWIKPGQTRDIDSRLGMAGAHQHTAITRLQRKDMAGRYNLVSAFGAINRDSYRARTISRGNAGCDAVAGFNRCGKCRFMSSAVILAHHI